MAVPRFLDRYTAQQCDSKTTLFACGWSEDQIDSALGEPDSHKEQGGPAYGADRAFLAMLDLVAPDEDSPRGHRTGLWLGGLDEAEAQTEWPVALPIKLEGFGWMAICRSDSASVGAELMLVKRKGADPVRVKQVHGTWEGFSLVKTAKT